MEKTNCITPMGANPDFRDLVYDLMNGFIDLNEERVPASQYVANEYADAVWRRKDTMKWYGAILTVQKNKLKPGTNEFIEIADLRVAPEDMAGLLQKGNYYPGWHMNKKNWYTVILDESVSDQELAKRIRISYDLANK